MLLQQAFRAAAGAAALVFFSSSGFAATVLSANVGWAGDDLSTAGGSTNGSPFTFTLLTGQVGSFKVTDAFITGDSYNLFVNGSAVANLASTAYAGAANAIAGDSIGENAWLNSGYEKFDFTFSTAGNYSFDVKGDGFGGVPAGYYFRLDVIDATVPEPSSLALASLALLGLGVSARRRKNAA